MVEILTPKTIHTGSWNRPYRPKYSPQHPIVKHPQAMFPLHTLGVMFCKKVKRLCYQMLFSI